jgi:hypothetical protein
MGKCYSTINTNKLDYNNFCPLRIASLYADIDESINKEKKINIIVDYFMKSYYAYNLDVFCIQGIHSFKILKELLSAFKKRISTHNNNNYMGYNNAIYVEYSPNINTENTDNDIMWNTSELGDEIKYYDKIIISRHRILQNYDIQIGTERQINMKTIDSGLMKNNIDSEADTIYKYIQIVNLNVDGTFVSIYNVELENDTIGISNIKERKKQLKDLKMMINLNKKLCSHEEMRIFEHGDNMFVASNRNLHIVTGMFHINAIKNGSINPEYNKLCSILSGFDTHRWVCELLKKPNTSLGISNVKFTKDSYTFIVSEPLLQHQKMTDRELLLFKNHKTVIISSNIAKNHVDMNQFTNYPEDTLFMLYRPDIELCDTKFNNNKQKKYYNKRNSNNTTQFIEQFTAETKYNTRYEHPKYGNYYNCPRSIRDTQTNLKSPPRIKSFQKHILDQTSTGCLRTEQCIPTNTYTKNSRRSSYKGPELEHLSYNTDDKTSPVKPIKKNVFLDICTTVREYNSADIELKQLSRYDNNEKSIDYVVPNHNNLLLQNITSDIKTLNTSCDNSIISDDEQTLNPDDEHSYNPANEQTLNPDDEHSHTPANEQTLNPSDTNKNTFINLNNVHIGDENDEANALIETIVETINNDI